MQEHEARDALERAQVLGRRVRHHGAWLAGYCSAFGTASFVLVLTIGLLPGTPVLITGVLFAILIAGLVLWAATRPVSPRHFVWMHTGMILGWGVLYGVALHVGLEHFPKNPLWWIPAAAVTALPGLVVALLVLLRSRGTT